MENSIKTVPWYLIVSMAITWCAVSNVNAQNNQQAINALPVIATLRDTSHDGFLDMIDIEWTDNSIIKTPLPSVGQVVAAVSIITLNGKRDSLHPVDINLDSAYKVIHIILCQNTMVSHNNDYETGWVDAKIVLSADLAMTTDGKPLAVTHVIDGAVPIPVIACCIPGPNSDSLWIMLSEPIIRDFSSKPSAMLYLQNGRAPVLLSSLSPIFADSLRGWILFVFNSPDGKHVIVADSNKIAEQFNPGPNSPPIRICGSGPAYVPTSNSHCGQCGTGTCIAFIPPFFFYARCHIKSIVQKKEKT
jgi:hypothetical protein